MEELSSKQNSEQKHCSNRCSQATHSPPPKRRALGGAPDAQTEQTEGQAGAQAPLPSPVRSCGGFGPLAQSPGSRQEEEDRQEEEEDRQEEEEDRQEEEKDRQEEDETPPQQPALEGEDTARERERERERGMQSDDELLARLRPPHPVSPRSDVCVAQLSALSVPRVRVLVVLFTPIRRRKMSLL